MNNGDSLWKLIISRAWIKRSSQIEYILKKTSTNVSCESPRSYSLGDRVSCACDDILTWSARPFNRARHTVAAIVDDKCLSAAAVDSPPMIFAPSHVAPPAANAVFRVLQQPRVVSFLSPGAVRDLSFLLFLFAPSAGGARFSSGRYWKSLPTRRVLGEPTCAQSRSFRDRYRVWR